MAQADVPRRRTGPSPAQTPARMERVIARLRGRYGVPARLRGPRPDPFQTLIACVLSLRTKDEVTAAAAGRLFARAADPRAMSALSARTIERLIFPAGFYRTKAAHIRRISRLLLETHKGRTPDSIDELLTLPGVGRKTANLVVTVAFGRPGICVDTHVHRISNRLGWVRTRHPVETEAALRDVLPRRHWITINELLVRHGQQTCRPLSPFCSTCPVNEDCPKVGVARSR